MPMNLRPLQPDDRSPLAGMLSRIMQFDAEDFAVAMELIDTALQNEDQKDYKFIIATEETGQIMGYICFGPTPMTDRVFCLYWIGVDPIYEGRGIGSRLLQAMEEQLTTQNARMIFLETSSASTYELTRRFYLKHDYALTETFRDFYQAGEDRLTFVKKLPDHTN